MAIEPTKLQTQPDAEERLAWHKPEVQRLVINLDTGNFTGSGPDGETHGLRVD